MYTSFLNPFLLQCCNWWNEAIIRNGWSTRLIVINKCIATISFLIKHLYARQFKIEINSVLSFVIILSEYIRDINISFSFTSLSLRYLIKTHSSSLDPGNCLRVLTISVVNYNPAMLIIHAWCSYLRGKNGFAKRSKILAGLYIRKVKVLLNYQNNYVEHSN